MLSFSLHSSCLVTNYDLEDRVNSAVFPGHQGGPHNHTITALAVALKQATTPEYKQYQTQVLKNNQRLAKALQSKGYELVSGGTDNHLILVDLRPKKLNGAKVEKVLELANIALNKNTVPGDVSAMNPGGVRLGTPALTSRGFVESDFDAVAEFVHRGVNIALDVQAKLDPKAKMPEFRAALEGNEQVKQLRKDVVEYARKFAPIGFTKENMKFKD